MGARKRVRPLVVSRAADASKSEAVLHYFSTLVSPPTALTRFIGSPHGRLKNKNRREVSPSKHVHVLAQLITRAMCFFIGRRGCLRRDTSSQQQSQIWTL